MKDSITLIIPNIDHIKNVWVIFKLFNFDLKFSMFSDIFQKSIHDKRICVK